MDVYMLVWGIIVFMLIVAVGLAAALLSMEGKYTAAIHSYLGKDVNHSEVKPDLNTKKRMA
jgi:Na+(H+)/acetate symporter ActP